MYQLTQKFQFCYGHRLQHHPGKCRNLHGHTATAEIELHYDTLQSSGMAIDFFEIKSKIGEWIDRELDHQMLLFNKDPICIELDRAKEPHHPLPCHPTAENIARLIFEAAHAMKLPIASVTLWESDRSAATYYRGV
ncbi:MAG: 6-pyruvoyl tetrahydrobiopterin synthase [Deltaproteobacteria bacterium CG11_big_fil_rev_8_21_14_0_20_47_16]|nr:MAG: 6-pyruvoyl tetrahydrobiopterin synthase [Deltaproteobacteria bacterium CG11_big_fil_rev_8_21_14_0_20_47_16]